MLRSVTVLAMLVMTAAVWGCEVQPREDVEPTPPAAMPPTEPAPPRALDIPFEEDAWPANTLEVSNETDREVSVAAIVEGRVQELGLVPPGEAARFQLRAEHGVAIQLEARDHQEQLIDESTLRAGPAILHWSVSS